MGGDSCHNDDGIEPQYLPDRSYICSDDSTDESVGGSQIQEIESFPDTSRIERNDISIATKKACGIIDRNTQPVPCMLQKRALGHSFSMEDKRVIRNCLLPTYLNVIAKHEHKVFCGVYSADAKLFLTASQDKKLCLYRTNNGQFREFKRIHAKDVGWSILDTVFSPDNKYIAYSTWSESIYLCPLQGEQDDQISVPLAPRTRGFCVFSLVFSTDSREILIGTKSGYIYVLNPDRYQRSFKFVGHKDDVNRVVFADDSSRIIFSAGDDGICKVWDRRALNSSNPSPVGCLAGHMDGITYIDSRGDCRYLITNSKDQTIKLWDLRYCSDQKTVENARKCVMHQNWDYRWQLIPKRLCKPYKILEGDSSVMTYRGHTVVQTLIRCHFSPAFSTGQRYIYTGCAAGRVIIYDVLTGKIVRNLTGHMGCVRDVSWHPTEQELVSSAWDGMVVNWRYGPKNSNWPVQTPVLPCVKSTSC